ncbi:unnamed protein product [Adineta ricciae]|uniref:NHL repeat containing protein-like protein n=1 Tax=Adineta ricciae TaxID=249248 RepID=A0A814TAL7_ADIRI|nr:unnamed protein product [Adineta ricciae]CAF1567946.1 unnamed protein product [Adineta ricciae]
MSVGDLFFWLILLSVAEASNVSYNQPKLDAYAVWNPNAILFANSSLVGANPRSLFVDTNDTVYVVDQTNNRTLIWFNNSINPSRTIYGEMSKPMSIFVTTSGDMYISDYNTNNQTRRWSQNSNGSSLVMSTSSGCYGLFIDINNTLYCSLYLVHRIVKKWLGNNASTITTIAGNGSSGFGLNQLNNPGGIFVTTDFDLYVADYANNRIQLFQPGQSNGITVAGSSSINVTIILQGPNAVILDADSYVFVTDYSYNRIVGSGPNGFRCIVGCTLVQGTASNQLKGPWNLAFDSHGNLYANEWGTSRILKYTLLNNTGVKSYNQPKLCSNATWSVNGSTFANRSIVGSYPSDIFIDTNGSIYVVDKDNDRIQVWFNNSINPTRTISGISFNVSSIFVANDGNIYIDNGMSNGYVNRYIMNTNSSTPVMAINSYCSGLFIDTSDTLYCSLSTQNNVVKKWLGDSTVIATVVAGNVNGANGSSLDRLSGPRGIFVNDDFVLYVADSQNDRIQLFELGQSNGVTVAGNTSLNITVILDTPTGITLDADNYLFIMDRDNERIHKSHQYPPHRRPLALRLQPRPLAPRLQPRPLAPRLQPRPLVPHLQPRPLAPRLQPRPLAPRLQPRPHPPHQRHRNRLAPHPYQNLHRDQSQCRHRHIQHRPRYQMPQIRSRLPIQLLPEYC